MRLLDVVIVSFQKRLLPAAVLLCIAPLRAPAQQYNTWTSEPPMPFYSATQAVGVINGKIYLVSAARNCPYSSCPILPITQIYDPATDTWSAGAPLPVATGNGAPGAVVKNILYVFGGGTDSEGVTSAVWAYNPETNSWSSKSPMPTARGCAGAAVENDIIYVIGGCGEDPYDRLASVESYDPATDMWTEEAPLLVGKSQPNVGLVGTTIVAAGGYVTYGETGDNEGYDVTTNSWTSLTPDPMPRNGGCTGVINGKLVVAGGSAVGTLTESFNLSNNSWKTLAPMPTPTVFPGSAVYKGQLYCFGGLIYTTPIMINNLQIYQGDSTPPVVVLGEIIPGPPKQVVLATHDTESGLASLDVLECTNCTAVSGTFIAGTNDTVDTTATKTNQSESSTIKLEAIDVAGNSTIFDPVDFEIQDGGMQRSHTVNISPAERVIKIANGTPGVREIEIKVNEETLPRVLLTDGEDKTIDIGRYILPKIQNKVLFAAYGPTGAKSCVVITQR